MRSWLVDNPRGGVGEVALGIHLDMLHLVFQATMGWSNSHLWLIQANGSTWGVPDPEYRDDIMPVSRTSLIDMVADIGARLCAPTSPVMPTAHRGHPIYRRRWLPCLIQPRILVDAIVRDEALGRRLYFVDCCPLTVAPFVGIRSNSKSFHM